MVGVNVFLWSSESQSSSPSRHIQATSGQDLAKGTWRGQRSPVPEYSSINSTWTIKEPQNTGSHSAQLTSSPDTKAKRSPLQWVLQASLPLRLSPRKILSSGFKIMLKTEASSPPCLSPAPGGAVGKKSSALNLGSANRCNKWTSQIDCKKKR